jgi:hypothetical protein
MSTPLRDVGMALLTKYRTIAASFRAPLRFRILEASPE